MCRRSSRSAWKRVASSKGEKAPAQWEEIASMGCAVQNLHLSLEADGYHGYWSSGGVNGWAECDATRAVLGLDNAVDGQYVLKDGTPVDPRVLGFFFVGCKRGRQLPDEALARRREDDVDLSKDAYAAPNQNLHRLEQLRLLPVLRGQQLDRTRRPLLGRRRRARRLARRREGRPWAASAWRASAAASAAAGAAAASASRGLRPRGRAPRRRLRRRAARRRRPRGWRRRRRGGGARRSRERRGGSAGA